MNESPFSKKETSFKKEQSTIEKISNSVATAVNDTFIDSLPSDDIKQLPPSYMYPLGTILFSILIAIFVGIFVTGYQSSINTTFLSPVNGDIASKYCEPIALANTGSYLATQSGLWEGSGSFQYSLSAYLTTITSYSVSYSQYQDLMNSIFYSLVPVGQLAMQQDLAMNLVTWMSLAFVPPQANNAQRFMLTGTPLTVFDRQKTMGTMSNVFGDCNATSTASFDSNSGILLLTYSYSDFTSNPLCVGIIDPILFGYNAATDGDLFSVEFDIRTLATGVAVNLGVLDLSWIVQIEGFQSSFAFDGVTYNTSSYYDPKYPGMSPVTCITGESAPQCILNIGGFVYALPFFNHAGQSGDLPVTCDCSTLTAEDLASKYAPCNLFSLLSGFIFFNSTEPFQILQMSMQYNQDLAAINRATYNASFIGSYWGQTSSQRALLDSAEYRQKAFAFCTNPQYGSCSIMTYSSFDNTPSNWAISAYYFQLSHGACTNSFYTSYADWENLVTTPYAPLTQSYQQCRNDPTTVLLNQAGVSVGNVSIVTPFCVLFVLLGLYLYQWAFGISIPKAYSKGDKDRALNTLAISLLLARDNCLKTSDNKQQMESLLMKLVTELSDNSELSSNQYSTEVVEESGVNWDYIAERAMKSAKKTLSPLHRGSISEKTTRAQSQVSVSGSSRSVVSVDGTNTRSAGKEKHTNIELTEVASSSSQKRNQTLSSSSGGGSGVAVLDPNIIILNKPSSTAAERLEANSPSSGDESSSSHGDNNNTSSSATVAVDSVLDSLEDYIRKFKEIARNSNDGSSSPAYWILASKTSALRSVRVAAFREHSNEMLKLFYTKLEELITIHASLSLSCEMSVVFDKYSTVVAYAINDEVLVLKEVRRRGASLN